MYKFKLSKLLKILLVTALAVLCLLVAWAIVLYVLGMNLQWWGKAMILICLAASILMVILLRKLIQKRREMKFVDGIIGPDEMPGNISALDDASRELRRRFKKAISTLKKSDLKRKGNPLYVLPWYLMVGRSGSGKSTAVKSARLPSPFGDINRVAGIEGTRNCDWWFFDDSVVIDIAGRYSVHRNEKLDKKEWRTFLEHMVKYRKKEPINGVIVTVEADQLLEGNLEKIEDEGRTIRKRIDEITAVMGAKFPVYLLVTKSDLIYGINRYCHLLSESSVSQSMGLMNHDGETDIAVFVDRTIDTVTEKLKDIRLILANKGDVKDRYYIDPEVLLFPSEFARLREGLIAFCKGAFKENPFQELPFLRGIYFCSGRQEGRPVNSEANSLGMITNPELPGTGNGFFLHDFFAKIVPSDRSLYSMTRTARQWNRLTHNLWLTAFVTIVLVFCILLTYSWNQNKALINMVSPAYKKAVLFNDDPIGDIGIMADFSREIKAVEERNRNWKIPRLGLNASLELEQILKKRFCERFRDHFDAGINRTIESRIANGGWNRDDYATAARYIPFVVRRINMIRARFDGATAEELAELPSPNFAMIIIDGKDLPVMEKEVTDRYKYAYINYLVWQKDVETLNTTTVGLQRLLQNYFQDNQGDLRWLTAWADLNLPDQAVTLNHFWHSNSEDTGFVSIPPAFTREGRLRIGRFVSDELEKAVEQPLWIVKPKEEFVSWYKNEYFNAWTQFAQNFSSARKLFPGADQWAAAVERFTRMDSPYLTLLKSMEGQLTVSGEASWPAIKPEGEKDQQLGRWLDQIKTFGIIRNAVASEKVTDNKAAEKLTQRVGHKTRLAGELVKAGMAESELAKAKHAYKQYQEALQGFNGVTASRSRAYAVARAGFEDDPADSKSPLFAAQNAVKQLRTTMSGDGNWDADADQTPFWHLITEPVDVLWQYSVARAGDHLQHLWDREVMVKIEGVYDRHQLISLLFGDQGYADKFNNNHAGPFVSRSSRRGFRSRKLNNCAIPFRNSYFAFIRKGKRWNAGSGGEAKPRAITVAAFPTDVNIEARVKPHMTRLVLENVDGRTILENRQYPVEKKFIWSPSKSGDVSLQIMLGDITLVRKYTGYCAFGRFLMDFKGGKRTFTVEDFPEYRHDFTRLGVSEIQVSYQFTSGQTAPIIRQLSTAPGRPPARIVSGGRAG
ncbi:MAG: type VI secretion protein IcmF/TssM N-terminal domain-containing protein [Desulfobacteraceae bacterium]